MACAGPPPLQSRKLENVRDSAVLECCLGFSLAFSSLLLLSLHSMFNVMFDSSNLTCSAVAGSSARSVLHHHPHPNPHPSILVLALTQSCYSSHHPDILLLLALALSSTLWTLHPLHFHILTRLHQNRGINDLRDKEMEFQCR
jgi:hypothetical protein